jgi:flagellar basal-body rod modification protein FlgD
MITQMKNQDPTQPFKAEQMAEQLAQFASVEQLQNMNQQMTKMATQNAPLERLAMTNMIGKTVTVDRERFPHAEGSNDSLNFVLPKDAARVNVAIVSEAGETVFEKEIGEHKAGPNTYVWDGIRANTLPAKAGNYMFRVTATGEKGESLQIVSQGQARVVGVSFEGQEPVFLVGDPARPDKVTLRNVVRVDSDAQSQTMGNATIPGAQSLASAVAAAQKQLPTQAPPAPEGAFQPAAPQAQGAAKPNYFSFEKGKGSFEVDPSRLPPEAAAALSRYEQERQVADAARAAAPADAAPEDRGFPNGLSDSN